MDLQQIVAWLAAGGCGIVVYWLMDHVPFLVDMDGQWKRVVSVVFLPLLVGALAFGAAVFTGYEPTPENWQGIVTGVMLWIVTAVSQVTHGARDLKR
jgi:hypothetical protein